MRQTPAGVEHEPNVIDVVIMMIKPMTWYYGNQSVRRRMNATVKLSYKFLLLAAFCDVTNTRFKLIVVVARQTFLSQDCTYV